MQVISKVEDKNMLEVIDNIFMQVQNLIKPETKTEGADSAAKIGNQILGIIQVVGIILSVGCLMILGIKYMMGSAEEKAEYKKTFIPYLIGAFLLFAASAFAKTIYNWVTNIKV